jgi:hypothetical protein
MKSFRTKSRLHTHSTYVDLTHPLSLQQHNRTRVSTTLPTHRLSICTAYAVYMHTLISTILIRSSSNIEDPKSWLVEEPSRKVDGILY